LQALKKSNRKQAYINHLISAWECVNKSLKS